MAKVTTNKQQLVDIAQEIVVKNVCSELRDGAIQLVFADGNSESEVIFIGEAPGKNEDEQGIPFVGAAGKFLNELLKTVGLKRGDIYITNIVKYRPPNNRDPLPEEKKAFWPYLVRQIEVIKPKLVVTLGRHSMEYFLPNQKISEIHGQPKQIELGKVKLVLMPLYHPAAALYNGSLRQTLLDDFSKIPTLLQKIDRLKE